MESNNFFDLIQSMTSEIEVEILKCQGINNISTLLRAKDLYSLFDIECEELEDLRKRACLKLNDGKYMVRPAIKENLDYCINLFKNKFYQSPPQQEQPDFDANTRPDHFVDMFINNLVDNKRRSKHRYQYTVNVRRFASLVYTLGGRNVYELLRLNIPGAFPSITTLDSYNNEYCTNIEEAEFRFDELTNYSNRINCSFAYASEDCTGVIRKVEYDAATDSFIGFCPTSKQGLPTFRQYRTNDIFQLEEWFQTIERSKLVDICTIKHITSVKSPAFLLSCFGTDNKNDSICVLNRWLYIHKKCFSNKIKIVGFSSDADAKYLRTMRLVTGYFAELLNIDLFEGNEIFEVTIPKSWSSWFYLRSKQLFLCFQDPTHLATKLRNRLLSTTQSLMMGDYQISIKDLEDLIDNYSKLDHNLVISDLYVKDKQNYASCVKISSENVLNILGKTTTKFGTHCYLTILRYTIIAYIDKTTNILKRIFYAWSMVFICRFWWSWLRYKSVVNQRLAQKEKPSMKKIEKYFITLPAFYSIEINAHILTFIVLLVLEKKLPIESLNIFLFNSQHCEDMFRSARALTGPFSSMTNFTIRQFLAKTRNISILNSIKCLEESNVERTAIKFPTHHKQKQNNLSLSTSTSTSLDAITLVDIEPTIYDAYENAKSFIEKLGMSPLLKKNKAFKLNDLCSNLRDDLESMIYVNEYSELESDDSSDDEQFNDLSSSDINSEGEDECSEPEDECKKSTKEDFNGMRIYSTVADKDRHKFFKISINGNVKYIHKQTAAWYFTENNNRLSSDRLIRVQESSRQ